MSILRPVIRHCAVGALRNKTWCEERVYDSDMTPLAEAVLGQAAKPYCVVYTDTDDMPVVGKAELYDGRNRALQLSIEIGVASAVREPDPTGPFIIKFAATDAGMEFACDIIESQVINALVGDPHSDWGNIFRRLTGSVTRMQRRRGGQAQQGVRWAARRVVLTFSTIYDIAPGVRPPVNHPLWKFIELAKISPLIKEADVATIIEDYMTETAPDGNAPDWLQAAAHLGLARDDAREVLVTTGTPLPWPGRETPPLSGWEDEAVPGLERLTLEQNDDSLLDVHPTTELDEPAPLTPEEEFFPQSGKP